MIRPEYFLEKHQIVFQDTESAEERLRRMTTAFGVKESYEGDDPYIFISYAHKDSALVLPAVKAIQEAGYPVWYDAGISPGSEWAADIAQHLKNASLVLAFVSKSAFDSNNCRAEIVYAFGHRKPMLTIRLDKTPLPDGLDMQLSLSQMFDAFAYDDGDEYVRRLAAASIIPEVLEEALVEKWRKEEEAARKRREEAERRRLEEEAAERKRQEEAERRRLEEEAAERKRQEEAERRRLEEEAAEQKYQQAKEAARQRREMEEAQQRRWDAAQQANEEVKRQRTQAQQAREEANKQKKAAAQQAKLCEAQAEPKAKMEKHYQQIETYLAQNKLESYRKAIFHYNNSLAPCVKPGLELEAVRDGYRKRLCNSIYTAARQFEKTKRTQYDACHLFAALPDDYLDAKKKKLDIGRKYDRIDFICGVVFALLHLALNVVTALQINQLAWPWYFGALLMLAPAQVTLVLMTLCKKIFRIQVDITLGLLLFSFVLPLIGDAFLFQFVGKIWLKILSSILVNVLGAASVLLWVLPNAGTSLPQIK